MKLREIVAAVADYLDGYKIYILQAVGAGVQIAHMFQTKTFDWPNFAALAINLLTAVARMLSKRPGVLAVKNGNPPQVQI